ncbi:MAG: rRNA maturation RNase YbeY [Tannerella sp.]|jgi:rRNA maturation RNase YbeY|nr:rRNA maturation RNase YbeY [Tannerella sp.]
MAITYITENVTLPRKFGRRLHTRWIHQIAQNHGKKVNAITFIFCNDERILEINRQYLKHDYYTDIITFDDSEGDKLSGDILISLDTVKSNSIKFRTEYEEELSRVIIHGILHLCGFADNTSIEKKKMRNKEDEALNTFKLIQQKSVQLI